MKKRLVINSLIIITTALGLFVGLAFVCSQVPLWHNRHNAFLEVRLFKLQEPEHYDVLIAGSSKGMMFTENTNRDSIELILNANVTNISKVGAGVLPMNVMLKYFYSQGNTAKHIIKFVDTQDFYSAYANELNDFMDSEPLDITLASIAWEEGIEPKMFGKYVQSKYRWRWLHVDNAHMDHVFTESMPKTDTAKIAKRMKILFPDSARQEYFDEYSEDFYRFIETAREHNSKITFIILPHLLGPLPGHEQVLGFLEKIKQEEGIEYYDYSHSLDDLKLFTDHDHMNALGVNYAVRNYLKPIIDKDRQE